MASMMKHSFTQRACAPARRGSVSVQCQKVESGSQRFQATAAAAAALAAILTAGPVSAKVIIEQPQLKKVFQEEAAAPAPKKAIILPGQKRPASAPTPAAPKPVAAEYGSDSFDPKSIALPFSLVAIAGGAAALSKLDEGFLEFMDTASAKNSIAIGAGNEVILKEGGGVVAKRR